MSSTTGDLGASPADLWEMADKLRGSVDAAEYKHVVLGLLFLKYVSDAFATRREALKVELAEDGIEAGDAEALLESRDEYTAENVFWVPQGARWSDLNPAAPDIAQAIDRAFDAIGRENPKLKGKLPTDYARRGIAPNRLGELVRIVSRIEVGTDEAQARDVLGRVYEYFLGKFAAAEGKLGGEFFTPSSIVRVMVEMIEPFEGRVYDPACGSGGMFVQSQRFAQAHGNAARDVSIYGQESNPTTWRLAHMNLAIRGISADLGSRPASTFTDDLHPDLKADYILANPPFNISDWGQVLVKDDLRWRKHGTPPAGNANYAWIQHFVHHLAPPNGTGGGTAAFVMANGSLTSGANGEGAIRRSLIEADLVDCIVSLPAQLFLTTGIPVCLWFVTRDKSGTKMKRRGRDRSGETLFIDARDMGEMETRTLRVLTGHDADPKDSPPPMDTDVGRIVGTYHAWRGEEGAADYEDVAGFCASRTIEQVAKKDFALTPGNFVGPKPVAEHDEPFDQRMDKLVAQLAEQFHATEEATDRVRTRIGALGYEL